MNKADYCVKYNVSDDEISLSPSIVKNYLACGNTDRITEKEAVAFIQLCRYQKLNPYLHDAYLIKYGDKPAQIVIGKDLFTKRAALSGLCKGWQAGIVVEKPEGGGIEYRVGTLMLPGEKLRGGWAKVFRKDYEVPIEATVTLVEYQKMKEGSPTALWREKPATMIRKVALVQALREAFPCELQALYCPEELLDEDVVLPPVTMPEELNEPKPEAEKNVGVHSPKPEQEPAKQEGKLTDVVVMLGKMARVEKVGDLVFRSAGLGKEPVLIAVKGNQGEEFARMRGGKYYTITEMVQLNEEIKFAGPLVECQGARIFLVTGEIVPGAKADDAPGTQAEEKSAQVVEQSKQQGAEYEVVLGRHFAKIGDRCVRTCMFKEGDVGVALLVSDDPVLADIATGAVIQVTVKECAEELELSGELLKHKDKKKFLVVSMTEPVRKAS